ncbi:MAG: tetratricopeptide repeat protein [Leptospira sp.]|nr:tetratricopeptide repeat protein [Leptospira sp.]
MVLSWKRWISFGSMFLFLQTLSADTNFDEGKYPSIPKSIRSTVLTDKKSAIVSWEPPKEEGEIIIARSNSVIDTPEKLYIADSLGRYKSGGPNGAKSYYDYNLKPGTYYYAVALVSDVRKREVKLFSSQNYTVIPVTIEDTDGSPAVAVNPIFEDGFSKPAGSVSNIHISLERNNIRLDWTAPAQATAGRTIYTIYRSTSPLTTLPLMQKADKLAEVGHPTISFLDQSLEKSQTLYYGVSVKEGKGEESLPLVDKQSTLRIFYVKKTNTNSAEVIADDSGSGDKTNKPAVVVPADPPGTLHVRGVGYERVGKGVVMSWLSPDGADESVVYSVYASTKPLNQGTGSFGSANAVKVASINHPKTNFYIKELKPMDELYFGITAKSNAISEDYNLKENVSYFRFHFDKDLEAPKESELVKEDTTPTNNTQKIEEPKLNNQHSVVPAEIRISEEDGLKDTDSGEIPSTVSYELSETLLNKIIKETILRKKFELAADRLEQFISNEKNTYLIGKAYLYLGVSYMKLGESKKALRYFLKRETKAYSPERTEFWTNQTLEKIGRGKV